jgi:hypothetical protein
MKSYDINSKISPVIRFINSEFTGPYEDLELMLNIMAIDSDTKEDIKNMYKPAVDEVVEIYTRAKALDQSIQTLRKTIITLQEQDRGLIIKYEDELRILQSKQYAARPPGTAARPPAAAAAPAPAPPPQKKPPAWVIKMREKQAARNAAKTKKGGRRRLRNITRRCR